MGSVWGFVNLWKDVMVTKDLVNLKEDGVSAEEAIDVKEKKKKRRENSRLVAAESGGWEWIVLRMEAENGF